MANSFKDILREASEMFDIAARMAADEAQEPQRREAIMAGLMELTKSCRELMMISKIRAEEESKWPSSGEMGQRDAAHT